MIAAFYFLVLGLLYGGRVWPSGWGTVAICVLFSLRLNALFLGIIGEYVGRLYKQQNRPMTIIEQAIERQSPEYRGPLGALSARIGRAMDRRYWSDRSPHCSLVLIASPKHSRHRRGPPAPDRATQRCFGGDLDLYIPHHGPNALGGASFLVRRTDDLSDRDHSEQFRLLGRVASRLRRHAASLLLASARDVEMGPPYGVGSAGPVGTRSCRWLQPGLRLRAAPYE